jgi:TPP-dependent indolepyruvate ferredoxin oxidoreductase alpha subunit
MEPVNFPEPITQFPEKSWAVKGTPETANNLITSIELDPDELERHNQKLQQKYNIIEEQEVRFEAYHLDDAEIVLMGFGIVSRILQTIVDTQRSLGVKIGLLRPITLFPFPKKKIDDLVGQVKFFLVAEMNNGQMVDDVRLAVAGRKPVHFYHRMGGNVPSEKEINDEILKLMSHYDTILQKSGVFYDVYERKPGTDKLTTTYCPGCGHGNLQKLIAEALIDFVSATGRSLSVRSDAVFSLTTISTPAMSRPLTDGRRQSPPESSEPTPILSSFPIRATGPGRHRHRRDHSRRQPGEGITVFFVNNAIYGMTGGQMAPTTLIGQKP